MASVKGLLRGVVTVGGFTMVSRVFGFVRDLIIARVFGASDISDAFFVAFRIPNFFRRIIGEGAFSQAFVPVLGDYKAQRSQAETRAFIGEIAGWLMLVSILVCVLGMVFSPYVLLVTAPGFTDDPEKFQLSAELLQIIFPYLFFISLTALAGGVLNTYEKFAIPAFTPVLLNGAMIFGALALAPYFDNPVYGLAWGVLLGGGLQLALQVPFLLRLGLFPWPKLQWHEGTVRVGTLMIPAVFVASASQINIIVTQVLGSYLEEGSISYLYYSDRLVEFPLGVFGVALGTVILPALSKSMAEKNDEEYRKSLDWALRMVWIVGLPATVGLLVLSDVTLISLFHYGAFDMHDVYMSQKSLIAYGLGILFIMWIKVLAPAFFSRQDTATPAKIAAFAVGINILASLLLIWPMEHAGLALAPTLAAIVNAGLLYWFLHKKGIYRPMPGWIMLKVKAIVAVSIMGGVLYGIVGSPDLWLQWNMAVRLVFLAGVVGLGAVLYLGLMALMGVKEVSEFRKQG